MMKAMVIMSLALLTFVCGCVDTTGLGECFEVETYTHGTEIVKADRYESRYGGDVTFWLDGKEVRTFERVLSISPVSCP